MRFEEAYGGWQGRRPTQEEAVRLRGGGERSYTWVKHTLQRVGLVAKTPGRGRHRRRCEHSPLEGMMLHEDGSTHEWVPGPH